jgi:tRNA-dihydrouridine synthase B
MYKEIGLSPMAGYTDGVMRELALEWGADFVFSEMLSVEGVLRSTEKTEEVIPSSPCRIQLFGSDPRRMAKAALKLKDVATWFDINAGCPVRKVTRRGAGSALLKDPDKIGEMIRALKEVSCVPVSVKIRLGWDSVESDRIIPPILEAKPDAVFIHGRTVSQGYSGSANWKEIESIAGTLRQAGILSYGSGDLFSPQAVAEALKNYSVDGVVVARGAIGNPWIFKQAKDLMELGTYEEFGLNERLEHFLYHIERLAGVVGEDQAVKDLRKSFAGYTRNIRYASNLRKEYMKCDSLEEVRELFRAFVPDFQAFK